MTDVDAHVPAGKTCRARVKSAQRQALIDQIEELQHKPTAAPVVHWRVAISTALSMFVPGPAALISATGIGVRLVALALDRAGYEIVPKERADRQ